MSQERFPVHVIQRKCFYNFKLGLMKKDVQNAMDLLNNTDTNGTNNGHQFSIASVVNELVLKAAEKYGEDADYTEVSKLFIDLHENKNR